MPHTYNVTADEVRWVDEAIGYDNVSTVSAAYERLIEFRKKIEAGAIIRVPFPVPSELKTTDELNAWVRERYPIFVDDPLHLGFRRIRA